MHESAALRPVHFVLVRDPRTPTVRTFSPLQWLHKNYGRMVRLINDDSTELDAEFAIVDTGDGLMEITVESGGGLTAGGRRRNPDYRQLLEELLRRCAVIDAVIHDVFVASRTTAALPLSDRRIRVPDRPFPMAMSRHEDFDRLRKDLTGPQANIGSARREGGGNERKRITMVISSPVAPTREALIAQLGAVDGRSQRQRRSGISAGLSVAHLEAAIERWRQVGREAFLREFEAPEARKYVVVDGPDEIDALALILAARSIAGMGVDGPWRGDRANVAVPLRNLGFAVEDLDDPREGPLGPDPHTYVGLAERLGGTDVAVRRMGRREQRFLRGALGIATGDANAVTACGLCGRAFPHAFLVAAHIKPRHMCSDAERLDLPHVGGALCVAGCDAMFEQGYVGVDDIGRIVALLPAAAIPAAVADLVEPLLGTRAPGWSAERAVYFKAHRTLHGA